MSYGSDSKGEAPPVAHGMTIWAARLLLFVMGAGWGLSFSLAKIAADGGAHPFGTTFWQTLTGGLILLATLAVNGNAPSLKWQSIRLYCLCGLIGAAIPSVLFYFSAAHLPAGVLSITVATVPLLTCSLAFVLGLERLSFLRGLGVVCGMAAIVVLTDPVTGASPKFPVLWITMACGASACYAVWTLVISTYQGPQNSPQKITCGMYLAAALFMLPIMAVTDSFVALSWPFEAVELAILGMGVISAVAYSVFIYLAGRMGPIFTSQASYVVTLSGVAWGMLIFGEEPPSTSWLALAIMIIGVFLVSPARTSSQGISRIRRALNL